MTALDPTMRVGRQVAEVLRLHQGAEAGPARQRVVAMLAEVGLDDPERIADAFPHQLSGGQRQRVILAMALINSPELVICDEPTTALDVTVQALVLQKLDEVLTAEWCRLPVHQPRPGGGLAGLRPGAGDAGR